MTISLTGRHDPDRYRVEERRADSDQIVHVYEGFGSQALAEGRIDIMLAEEPGRFAGHELVVVDRRSKR